VVVGQFGARAQDGAKEKFAQAQKQNAAQLRQYSWTSRTELKLKGESKNVKLESVRYDANGQLQKTPLDSGAPAPQQASPQKQGRGGGRVKAKIVENKKEEFKELLGDLAKLTQSYAHLTPEQTQAFAQSAKVTQGQGTMELQGSNVVVKGDSMTVVVDGSTFLIRQVRIDSLYENNPLNLTINYLMIPQGPSYSAKVDLSYPKKEVQVTVENSNYQHL